MQHGKGEIWVDGEITPIRRGDSVYLRSNTVHATRNTGDEPLMLLCFFSSPDYGAEGKYIVHEEVDF